VVLRNRKRVVGAVAVLTLLGGTAVASGAQASSLGQERSITANDDHQCGPFVMGDEPFWAWNNCGDSGTRVLWYSDVYPHGGMPNCIPAHTALAIQDGNYSLVYMRTHPQLDHFQYPAQDC
jgi:hypothetical protein